MLEIQEKFDTDGYEDLVRRSVGYDLHITEAIDSGQAVGFIAYAYKPEKIVIFDYDDGGELMLCDGLVRSVLFKSCLKGIETAVFDLPDDNKYDSLRKLRFLEQGSRTAENINRFMNGCKNCKHNGNQ